MRLGNFGVVFLSFSLGSSAGSLCAQGIITGSINGTIVDQTGAIISGAAIDAKNTGTGLDVKGTTSGKGEVTLSDVPVGTYVVTVEAPGFAPLKVDGIVVQTGATSSFGTQKLGITSSAEVMVSTGQNFLETTQTQVTTTLSAQAITDLPTGGGLDRLVLLVPGAVRTLSNNFSNSNGVGVSSNGQRGRSNNFEIDGQSNNDNSVAGPQFFFRNEDALGQLEIITNNMGAQYGRNAGSVVNYITKSGTNEFHGTAFENYFGSWGSSLRQGQKSPLQGFCAPGVLSAPGAVCTTPVVPRITANEYGGSLGGPILHDRLFGFGSTLFRAVTNGASPSISTTLTPTPTGLQQLQAAFPGNPFVASLVNEGPYSVKAGNPTSVSTTNMTVCATAVSVCPAGSPTVQFGTIQRLLPSTSSDQEDLGRLDYQADPKDRFYLRYAYQNAPTNNAGGTVSTGAYYDTQDSVHSVGSDWTRTFSSRWLNQLRYSFQQSKLVFGAGGYPTCVDATISNCASSVVINGLATYGPASNIPQGRIVKATQVQDNATFNLGGHNITFGGEFDYQNSPNVFLPNTSGTFNFTGGFNYGLAGVGTLTLANGAPNIPFREPDVAAYFQDDWKVTNQLTLNLGLRWEFFKQSVNLLHDLSVARQTGPNPIWQTSLPLSQTTFPYIPENYKNFEPRIGFAFNPSASPKTVLRGGFAINYDPQFYNLFLNAYTSAPVVNTGSIACNGTTVNCLPSGGTINAAVHAQDDQYNPVNVNPGTKTQTNVGIPFKNPIAESYTLSVQHQLGNSVVVEVRYAGNHSYDNFQSLNANPSINTTTTPGNGYLTLAQAFPNLYPASSYCTTAGAVGFGRPNCNLTYLTTRANSAFSIYNSLQTTVKTQDFHGLTTQLGYTFSRTIDNASEAYGSTGGSNTVAFAQNPTDNNLGERGVSGQSFPHVVSIGSTYSPKWYSEQHGVFGRLLGGYQVNMIYSYQSGQPWTPYQGVKANPAPATLAQIPVANQGRALYSFCDYAFNSTVIGNDACRPILSNRNAPLGSVGINGGPGVGYLNFATGAPIAPTSVQWLINNQYEALARGTPYPGVSRNTLRGDTINELDMSVFKTVRVAERVNLQLRINAFNVPNRAFYGDPDEYINDANPAVHSPTYASFQNFKANAGTIVGTPFGSGARNIQLGGKIIF